MTDIDDKRQNGCIKNSPSIPHSVDELLSRANALQGLSLGQLAAQLSVETPADFQHNKGWVGQLLELALGASAGSRPEPDFPQLGIELKTIPINKQGKPLESTYVCTVPLINDAYTQWQDSVAYHKLSHVLWMPIITEKRTPPAERYIGRPVLWQPSVSQWQTLQQDWEELMDMVCLGELDQITAHIGSYLQIRPKGANARSLCWGLDAEGQRSLTLPRGFYLRPVLTQAILN